MIGMIHYEAGNIASLSNALQFLGIPFKVVSRTTELDDCSGLLLPGVGGAPLAMESLTNQGLVSYIQTYKKPFLGICLGMQILSLRSEEGDTPCIGILHETAQKFDESVPRVPHMGWNQVILSDSDTHQQHPLFKGILTPAFFYFAHSYYIQTNSFTIATTSMNTTFSAAIQKDNFYGVQFHPEKSADAGLQLLRNFYTICTSFQP